MTDVPHIISSDGTVSNGVVAAPADSPVTVAANDLSYIRIDHQARLQFGETEVVIGTPLVLTVDDVEYHLDPEDSGDLGPLLALYPDALASGSVDDHGTLRLSFASGATISVPADPSYEAWQIVGPGRRMVVSIAGGAGDLVVWS